MKNTKEYSNRKIADLVSTILFWRVLTALDTIFHTGTILFNVRQSRWTVREQMPGRWNSFDNFSQY